MDAVKAFVQFLIDLFSALSQFLTGGDAIIDFGGMLEGLTGEDTSAAG